VLHFLKKGRKKRDFRDNGNLHRERCRCFGKANLARLGAGSLLMFFAFMVVGAERSEVGTVRINPLDVMMDVKTRQ
jgi:hypothetical protein